MKKDILEYIKAASLIVMAISLAIIAWKTASQIDVLQEIQESLNIIASRVNELKK
ncbi:hypothetical protein ACN6MY_19010 [Peribacillus sp. B-H-3]|uniref:hypothetical protein n=1 Tax=Peribacillus sp. B-H-3 TaxID=3400420 RepID=UPI003B01902F